MNILVVSATQFEVKPLLDFLEITEPVDGINTMLKKVSSYNVHVLITGVGMVNTAFMLGRHANQHFDLVINAGICGAFDKVLRLGEVVRVTSDILSEMGAEDGDEFLTYEQLNLPGKHVFSENCKISNPSIEALKKVKGITVNKVHGNDASIEKIKQLYHPEVESMEGAAFFAACEKLNVKCVQIRSISNYVERRDKSKWKMKEAIAHLNQHLIELLSSL